MLELGHPAWPSGSFATALLSAGSSYAGLDARAAAIVMRTVRNIVNTGRTIVCTIHQPSIDIFEAFDELLLLKRGGECIFNGQLGKDSGRLIDYFSVCCRALLWESALAVPFALVACQHTCSSTLCISCLLLGSPTCSANSMSVIAVLFASPFQDSMCTEAPVFLGEQSHAEDHVATSTRRILLPVRLIVSVSLCHVGCFCITGLLPYCVRLIVTVYDIADTSQL